MFLMSVNVYSSTSSISISDVIINQLSIKNVSGTVNVTKIASKDLSYDGVSGTFTLVLNKSIDNIKINQVSGESILSFPNEIAGFKVTMDTVSGSFYSDFESIQTENIYSYGESNKMGIDFSSVSGSLSIVKTEAK